VARNRIQGWETARCCQLKPGLYGLDCKARTHELNGYFHHFVFNDPPSKLVSPSNYYAAIAEEDTESCLQYTWRLAAGIYVVARRG
jgi:hypothetical protein